jgi:hypothetical protein
MKSDLGWWVDLENRRMVFEELFLVAHGAWGHPRVASRDALGAFPLRVPVCVIATDLCAFYM